LYILGKEKRNRRGTNYWPIRSLNACPNNHYKASIEQLLISCCKINIRSPCYEP
jgi:hypothetical protein